MAIVWSHGGSDNGESPVWICKPCHYSLNNLEQISSLWPVSSSVNIFPTGLERPLNDHVSTLSIFIIKLQTFEVLSCSSFQSHILSFITDKKQLSQAGKKSRKIFVPTHRDNVDSVILSYGLTDWPQCAVDITVSNTSICIASLRPSKDNLES